MRDKIDTAVERKSVSFAVVTDVADILALEPLAKEALEESRFNKATFSPEKFEKAAKRAANDPLRHGVLVGYFGGEPVGFSYCNIGEPLVATGILITTVQVLFTDPSVRKTILGGSIANKLLNGIESWGKFRNSSEFLLHVTSNVNARSTHRFLTRRGYKTVGGNYAISR